MNGIFDSHAHYDSPAFDEDREAVLQALPEEGVCGVINAASDLASARESVRLAENYPYIWAAVGVHPSELEGAAQDTLEALPELYAYPRAVAIGEIGLDYHYETTPREIQIEWFRKQLELAVSLDAPVIVHDREAHEDTLRLLSEYRPKGVVHCFSGSVEMMRQILSLGMYIGLGGAVTFKNARKPLEVAAAIPLNRLLLETDAPYMAPVPCRGKRCVSSMISHTAAVIASVRGISEESLIDQTASNVLQAFPKLRRAI